ncbi:MAG: histidine phosphatase family protein [Gammaproteobacteria bacterium]|nr:histidine phosphatase family protein [Rhodocyclaceae bacterium]MBU3907738.1 histidine phosphatase family protein [Gammaproteobacteria bacterium]MBU3989830.1 histidine phosphatase family protein [Gammaproteobacteria bacterium]MBU4004384.1 histidine phosphatase family protein [Gammaproteobacteria bacterium]MBU4019793.1 histidine phosphatase family protein [Gammaproteobacteria bacterium]
MKNPASVCVTRHGETDWNVSGILQGWTDIPLNDKGRVQARALAASFAAAGFVAVWSSPLVRSSETAEIIAAALSLPTPTLHDGLRERNFGAVQGVSKAELAELNPLLMQQIVARNPAAGFVSGETLDEFADRVLVALHAIGRHHAGQRVLVITHGWTMDVITRHASGLPRNTILNFKRKNGESVWLEATRHAVRSTGGPPVALPVR